MAEYSLYQNINYLKGHYTNKCLFTEYYYLDILNNNNYLFRLNYPFNEKILYMSKRLNFSYNDINSQLYILLEEDGSLKIFDNLKASGPSLIVIKY